MQLNDTLEKINAVEVSDYPFKHLVLNDFLCEGSLHDLQSDVRRLEMQENYRSYESDFGIKKEWKNFPKELSNLNQFLESLQGEDFISSLTEKFSLPTHVKISPDSTYDGGGYVISPPGSFLGYHADFNFSSNTEKYRILNVLYYMNDDYERNFGGHLHLLDSESKTVEKVVEPKINTLLAFLTDDISFHGVSRNASKFHRRSFNLYYYAEEPLSANQSKDPHKTLWVSPEIHNH